MMIIWYMAAFLYLFLLFYLLLKDILEVKKRKNANSVFLDF